MLCPVYPGKRTDLRSETPIGEMWLNRGLVAFRLSASLAVGPMLALRLRVPSAGDLGDAVLDALHCETSGGQLGNVLDKAPLYLVRLYRLGRLRRLSWFCHASKHEGE
jgi:hypothetical protein